MTAECFVALATALLNAWRVSIEWYTSFRFALSGMWPAAARHSSEVLDRALRVRLRQSVSSQKVCRW